MLSRLKYLKLFDSAIIIAIFTAILYSIGMAKHHGFLTEINLNPDMLERSFHLTVYYGVIDLSFGVMAITFFAIVLISIVGLMVPSLIDAIYIILPKKIKNCIKEKFNNFFSSPEKDDNWVTSITNLSINLLTLLTLIMLGAFLYALIMLHFERKGKDSAAANKELYDNGNYPATKVITTRINNENKDLFFLTCGSNNCSGIDIKTNKIYYFDKKLGYSFIYEK